MQGRFLRTMALAMSFATAALSGCAQQLGSDASSHELKGDTSAEQVFTDGPVQNHLRINGSALKSGKSYAYEGALTVKGDVPADVEISVTNGKLTVEGNVDAGSKLYVRLPVDSHTEHGGGHCRDVERSNPRAYRTGKTSCHVVDGLTFPADTDPAIKITGTVGEGVRLLGNGGIEVKGTHNGAFKYTTDWGRELKIGAP